MNSLLFFIMFTALGLLYVILGFRASRKVKTDTDYFVANRQLGIWQISSNLIATQLGGGMLLGTAASAYVSGYYGILYTLGMALGFLLLSCGIASRLQQFKITTTAELFEIKYKSPLLKKLASLLSIITLFGIFVAQVVGSKSLLTAIGFGSWWIILPFWLSIIAYTMIGGLRAITINDMVQLVIITITFGGIFVFSIIARPGSLLQTIIAQGQFTPEPISFSIITSIILMPALFSLIEQDLAQRFFASRSSRVARNSAFIASIFLLLFACIPVYFGMLAKLTNLAIPEGANPLIIFLQNSLPDFVFALSLCAIVAAIISTADALLNAMSANITQDFNIALLVNRNKLAVSKITTGLLGLCALGASYLVTQDIINILISSYELSVSCLLIPLLFCYFKKDVNKNAAFGGLIFGLIGFGLFRIIDIGVPKEIATLVMSLIGYLIGDKIKGK